MEPDKQSVGTIVADDSTAAPSTNVVTDESAKPPSDFYVSRKKMNFGGKGNQFLLYGGAAVVMIAIIAFFLMTNPAKRRVVAHGKTVSRENKVHGLMPGDRAKREGFNTSANSKVSPHAIAQTSQVDNENGAQAAGSRGAAAGNQQGAVRGRYGRGGTSDRYRPSGSLSSVGSFTPPPYSGHAYEPTVAVAGVPMSQGMTRALYKEVSKPSIIFAASAASSQPSTAATATTTTSGAPANPVTNFGLEPGFHVEAHLESSASTLGGTPVVAVVEYNYEKDGTVLIPAGSRAVGKLSAASSTGLVNMSFTELYLPDGERVPIHAVGLDEHLHLIKGKVTGRNTGKELALAALTGLGSIGATFASPNSGSAISQQQIAEMQIANNAGQGVNQVIEQMHVTQHVVVTVPAGVPLFLTFVAPEKRGVTNTGGQ